MRRDIFSEEHEMFRGQVRRFVENELVPKIESWNKAGMSDRESWRKMGAAGFLGANAPVEYGGAGADFLHAGGQADHASGALAHLFGHGGAFGFAALVEGVQRFAHAVQRCRGHFFAGLGISAHLQHAGHAERGIEVGLLVGQREKLLGLAKGGYILGHQAAIQPRSAAGRAGQGHLYLHVAASDGALQGGAQIGLERVELRRQMKVQVQAAMVDALQDDRDLVRAGGLSSAGEARHAAYAHDSPTPASTNCSSCRR